MSTSRNRWTMKPPAIVCAVVTVTMIPTSTVVHAVRLVRAPPHSCRFTQSPQITLCRRLRGGDSRDTPDEDTPDEDTALLDTDHGHAIDTASSATNGTASSATSATPTASLATSHAGADTPPRTTSRQRVAPSPLYRTLLRQGGGWGGHVLLVMLVWSVEWMVCYLPLVAALGRYLVRVLFQSMGRAVATTTRRAPKLSRRQRQTMQNDQTRQADWRAYQQLMQLKGTGGAASTPATHKYRHVSLDFMRRHGLGTVTTPTTTIAGTGIPTDSAFVLESTFSRAPQNLETDWMVQALRAPSKSSPAPRGDAASRHAQRTTAILQALHAASSPPTIPTSSSSSSSSNVASGLWSRRRWLGAYPGDAPPLDQAANPLGLESLAQRYGWSGESDAIESRALLPPRASRRDSTRRNRRSSVGFEFQSSSGSTRSTSSRRATLPLDSPQKRQRSHRIIGPESTSEGLSLRSNDSLPTTSATLGADRSHTIRPALQLLKDRQRQLRKKDTSDDTV